MSVFFCCELSNFSKVFQLLIDANSVPDGVCILTSDNLKVYVI